jgi:hypothetical protein
MMLIVHAVGLLFDALHPTRASPWRSLAGGVLVDALQGRGHRRDLEHRADERRWVGQLETSEQTRKLQTRRNVRLKP